MKQLKSIGILMALAILISSCKKTEEEPQVFIQKHILGAWPINYNIKTTLTDDVVTKRDTITRYNPIDTLVFTAEGKAIKRNKTIISTVDYTIAADGETITLATTPAATTFKFTFVHITSIGLGTETTTTVGGQKITTQIADHLNRK
jgi:PBP1b-binding outer membrane lipoprotein LpoB